MVNAGMKKLVGRVCVLALGLTLTGAQAFAFGRQQKDDLFAGTERFAVGAKDSTEVNLDKNMLVLAGGSKEGTKGDLMKKMDFVFVRSYEYDKPGAYKMEDVEAFSKRLEGDGWSHVVKERSEKESTDVCIKTDREGQVTELVVIDAEPKELNFVHLKGHLSMNEMIKAGHQYGVPGGLTGAGQTGDSDAGKLKKR